MEVTEAWRGGGICVGPWLSPEPQSQFLPSQVVLVRTIQASFPFTR